MRAHADVPGLPHRKADRKDPLGAVDLPSGGYIIIQEGRLCAIDVNTGKFYREKSQEKR